MPICSFVSECVFNANVFDRERCFGEDRGNGRKWRAFPTGILNSFVSLFGFFVCDVKCFIVYTGIFCSRAKPDAVIFAQTNQRIGIDFGIIDINAVEKI